MEGKALHDFAATSPDELSFVKGSIVKIINNEDDANWFKAEQDGRSGFIPSNYVEMSPHEWFHGRISRVAAEQKLMQCAYEGAFLFRESETSPGGFSLSVRVHNRTGVHVQHFKILRDDAGKYFLWVVKFSSLNELINYHKTSSVSRSEDIFLKASCAKNGTAIPLTAVPAPKAAAKPAPAAARAPAPAPVQQQQPRAAPAQQQRAAAPAPAPYRAPPAASSQRVVTAQFDFEPEEPGELRFKKGDIITIIDSSDASWWKGQCYGETGLFPASYVKG